MPTYKLSPRHLGSAREVVDVGPAGAGLAEALHLPSTVTYRAIDVAQVTQLDAGPETVVVALVQQDGPEALAALLRRLRPGARAVLFAAYAPEDLAGRLVDPLADADCQVIDVTPVDGAEVPGGVRAAVVVECVDKIAPVHGEAADDLSGLLRVVNRGRLSEFAAAPMRARIDELEERLAAADARADKARRQLRRSEARLATVESSMAPRVGRTIVDGVRHPARGVVRVPRDLARLAQEWRRGRPSDRVVRLPLPAGARGNRGGLVMKAPADMIVPRRLDEGGLARYEPDSMACFLAAADVAGPGAMYDVGANVGIFAALAGAMTSRDVRAFEPSPDLAKVARRFARDNKQTWRVETIALGAENGTATFYLSDKSDSSNSLAEGFRESSKQISVKVETVDSYVARTGAVPAVFKIDTESTEPDVLAGAAKTIAEFRPWIVCEVLANRVEDRLTKVIEPYGYHWYKITDEVPYEETREIVGDPAYRHLNWLFAPEVPGDRFWAALRERLAALRATADMH